MSANLSRLTSVTTLEIADFAELTSVMTLEIADFAELTSVTTLEIADFAELTSVTTLASGAQSAFQDSEKPIARRAERFPGFRKAVCAPRRVLNRRRR